MTFQRAIVWVLLTLFTAVGVPAAAQSGSGVAGIEGTVADPDNRAVVSALVIILSTETGYERVIFTDARGRYFAPAMPVGSYAIGVSAPGFARVQQEAVRLTVGVTATINFSLKVASVAETIPSNPCPPWKLTWSPTTTKSSSESATRRIRSREASGGRPRMDS